MLTQRDYVKATRRIVRSLAIAASFGMLLAGSVYGAEKMEPLYDSK